MGVTVRGIEVSFGTLHKFWIKVHRGEAEQCWPWMGKWWRGRRPCFQFGAITLPPQSFVWELFVGPVNSRKDVIREKCGTLGCCNPLHLYVGRKCSHKAVETTADRFNRMYRVAESGCWEWIGPKDANGYGLVRDSEKKKLVKASRVSLTLAGRDPGELYACHTCNNRSCVNPDHLYPGTPKQNSEDMVRSGRHRKGEDHPCSKLSDAVVSQLRADFGAGKDTITAAAKRLGVARSSILNAVTGKTYRHLSTPPVPISNLNRGRRFIDGEDLCRLIVELRRPGVCVKEVARAWGANYRTIYGIYRRYVSCAARGGK